MQKNHWNVLNTLLTLFVVALVTIAFYKTLLSFFPSPIFQKIYTSQTMHISFSIPSQDKIQESINTIELLSDQGTITISRIATNFTDVKDYMKDFDNKRKLTISSAETIHTEKYEGIQRIETFNEGPIKEQKAMYILKNGWVYTVSNQQKICILRLEN